MRRPATRRNKMIDVLRRYPWRQRLRPLFGASIVLLIVLRPTDWPLPRHDGSDWASFYQRLNILVWIAIVIPATAAFDFFAFWFVSRRAGNTRDETRRLATHRLAERMPSSFWTALAATLVCKAWVDFAFAGRPLPAGSETFFQVERWCDVFALAAFVPFYLFVRWLGPPSNWRLVRALVLEPPPQTSD